ncbi:MAG: hypothetical protein UX71_C0001G0090 [Parcubacteria group bacterium GW2011_GWA1_47_10]|nr:MAG: hypothetical protein UX71_C0001G0090 [Parcubacteria group bacterium GW2011_GWA1_47_10]KKU97658.1 MAG: hypothetical protein UY30_C0001G0004 [Parcubacteria group bacterium GW2011_GWB1_48_6]
MREASLKLYRGMQNVNIMNNNVDMPRAVLRAMLSTLGLLCLTYALLLGFMVWNIVERKNLEKEAQALSALVGDLELEYLSVSGSIDMELSRSMGFEEARASFAPREKALGSLELSRNEI